MLPSPPTTTIGVQTKSFDAFAETFGNFFQRFHFDAFVQRTQIRAADSRPRGIGKVMNGQNFVGERLFGQAVRTILDTVDFPAEPAGRVNHGSDDGVQSGAVAARWLKCRFFW